MQKQHVKINKHLNSPLPSRPQSEMKLRSLPSTPVISNTWSLSSLSSVLSPPAGQLGPLYETLMKENDNNKPPVDQPIRSCTQSQDIYSVVVKFRRSQSSDQLPVSPTEELQGIVHKPVIMVRLSQQQRQQQETSQVYNVVQKTKPVERAKCKDVHRNITEPAVANTRQLVSGHQQLHLWQMDSNSRTGTAGEVPAVVENSPVEIKSKTPPEYDIFSSLEDMKFHVKEHQQTPEKIHLKMISVHQKKISSRIIDRLNLLKIPLP